MKVILLVGFAVLMMFFSSFAFGNAACQKILVAKLNYSTDDDGLRALFEPYGAVTEAKVIMDRDTGRSRGFGFVTMSNCQNAATAIMSLNETEFNERTIVVKLADGFTNQRPSSTGRGGSGGSNRGGGGYGGGGGNRDDGNKLRTGIALALDDRNIK